MEYTVGQKVWKIEINNPAPANHSTIRKKGIKIVNFLILGISRYKIVINDDWFSTFYTKEKGERKESYKNYLDDISVKTRIGDCLLGDGVFISLYGTKKPTKAILNKMASKASVEIDSKFGFLFSGAKDAIYDLVDNYKL